ncbi:MAG: hypothetical protein ABW118_06520 [Candidatus Thiodiazotropha sp.]
MKHVKPFPDREIPDYDDEGLMVPPWVKYPNIPLGSIGWRMGSGETYWYKYVDWYKTTNDEIKKRVQEKYSAEGRWENFYLNLRD